MQADSLPSKPPGKPRDEGGLDEIGRSEGGKKVVRSRTYYQCSFQAEL